MKRFILLFAVLLPVAAMAQLKVDSTGYTLLGDVDNAPSGATLSIKPLSDSDHPLKITGKHHGLIINKNSPSAYAATSANGISASLMFRNMFANGVYSCSRNNVPSGESGYNAAIRGVAANQGGINYGVMGTIANGSNGAGIMGTTSIGVYPSISGTYAGYFDGNVKVTGLIDGILVSTSDGELKENMQTLSADTKGEMASLEKLSQLCPISYNYKDTPERTSLMVTSQSDELGYAINPDESEGGDVVTREPDQVLQKKHFGFVAQELQQVYPDLVYENDNGYLAINYTELIPILVQSIKELNAKVELLSGSTARKVREMEDSETGETSAIVTGEIVGTASMDQNLPNPFSEKTDIAIYLPETVKTATLHIYDLSGKQLEQHAVEGRGETAMTIRADKMDAGMYIYSLIADGKVVTSKKMIVVK